MAATGPVDASGSYDITVIGPNRFLRRFAGNVNSAGAGLNVTADYFTEGWGPRPMLTLTLANTGKSDVTFTVTPNNYSYDHAQEYRVRGGQSAAHELDPISTSNGWYDVTVTVSSDSSWSQRFTGHLENGSASVTG